MDRRKFLKSAVILSLGLTTPLKIFSKQLVVKTQRIYRLYLKKIIDIINSLKNEGSNLVLKIMNGKKYVFDPYYHYPWDGGVVDEKTGCRIFFHAHRKNEYGHFHTFVTDEQGELVHLVLISMNKKGIPTGLSTVNTWVTGDKYVYASKLKKYFEEFKMDPNTYKDKRVIEFIENIFEAYHDVIFNLFDEREKWVKNYIYENTSLPFENREYEVLSSKKIDVYKDKSS